MAGASARASPCRTRTSARARLAGAVRGPRGAARRRRGRPRCAWRRGAARLGRRLGVPDVELFGLVARGPGARGRGRCRRGPATPRRGHRRRAGRRLHRPAGGRLGVLLHDLGCEQVRDHSRAAQWCRRVDEFSPAPGHPLRHRDLPRPLRRGPHLARRLAEAERELLAALERLTRRGRSGARRRSSGSATCAAARAVRRGRGALRPGAAAPARPARRRGARARPRRRRRTRAAGGAPATARRAAAGRRSARRPARAARPGGGGRRRARRGPRPRPPSCAPSPAGWGRCRSPRRPFSDGLVAQAAGDPPTAREHLEDAVDCFDEAGAPLEAARARRHLACALQALGEERRRRGGGGRRGGPRRLRAAARRRSPARAAPRRRRSARRGPSRPARSRSCASWPRAWATARSPSGWCSASTPSTVTWPTSTRSWAARRGPQRSRPRRRELL